jgi:hypothetical protein
MRSSFVFLPFLALFCVTAATADDPCARPFPGRAVTQGDSLAISFSGISSFDVNEAEAYWSGGCAAQYGSGFPMFNNYQNGYGIPVSITFIDGRSPSTCGKNTVNVDSNHAMTSATITLYASDKDGGTCSPYSDSLAHEFGHILGLDDGVDPITCFGRIMGSRATGGIREIEANDCQVADQMWTTSQESNPPPPDPYCDASCWTYCQNNVCPYNPYGPPQQTPILIDLDRNGFNLSGVEDGVLFDLAATGHLEHTAWTLRDQRDAFLTLDRNGNHTIDDGSELFGNATPLANGARAPNGYVALAEFDKPELGGNGNGFIDPGDAVWSRLRLWIDENHDGISQPWELHPLEWAHLTRIGLKYVRSPWTDENGNQFRFLGAAWYRGADGREHRLVTTDVIFVVHP